MLSRHSIDWAGDMIQSPHGDWVHVRDVERLQDDLEASQKAKAILMARIAELEAKATRSNKPAQVVPGGSLFGFVNPDDARRFKSGRKESCKVYRCRTDLFCMPVSSILGPNHYQKPPVGADIVINGGMAAVVTGHIPTGLTVTAEGQEFECSKWSWRR